MAILDGYMGAKFILLTWSLQNAVVAEWLRRLTRNQFRSAGVGSNPTDREYFLVGAKFFYICIRVGPTAPTPCSKLVPVAIVFILI